MVPYSPKEIFFPNFFFLMINWLSAYFITQGMWCRGGREGEEFDDDLMQQYIIATTAFFSLLAL